MKEVDYYKPKWRQSKKHEAKWKNEEIQARIEMEEHKDQEATKSDKLPNIMINQMKEIHNAWSKGTIGQTL